MMSSRSEGRGRRLNGRELGPGGDARRGIEGWSETYEGIEVVERLRELERESAELRRINRRIVQLGGVLIPMRTVDR